MMLERKKRLKSLISTSSPSCNTTINNTPSQLTHNWATVGFFDANPTFESIRQPEEIGDGYQENIRSKYQNERPTIQTNKQKSRGFYRLSSLDIDSDNIGIEIGDVFEQVRKKHVRNGTRLLYEVIEIFPHSKSVLVKSVYGKEKKTFKELLDQSEYQMIVTDKTYTTKRTFQAQQSLRDPLLRDKVKYSGREGRDSLFSLFRQAPDDCPIIQPKDPLASPRPITPRLSYVLECRRQHIPPIPLLTRCFQESYPVLDLSNQSIGGRYILPLAQSIGNMKFLKEINLTNNRLDSKGILILMRGIANSSIESIILDENKIGKMGIKALQCLVSGEWNEIQDLDTNSIASSSPCSASSSVTSSPSTYSSSTYSSSVLPFSPIQKSRNSVSSIQSSYSGTNSSQTSSSISTSLPLYSISPPRQHHEFISSSPLTLKKLSLKSCSLGDNILSKLIKSLEYHCLTLRSLNISTNSCSSFTISSLSTLLSSNVVPLETLDITWNHLGMEHASTLLRSLASNSTLKKLYLDYNGLHSEILSIIVTIGGMKSPLNDIHTSTGNDKNTFIVQLPSNQTIELISLTNNLIPIPLLHKCEEIFLTELKLVNETRSLLLS